jgi:hypothetical protein
VDEDAVQGFEVGGGEGGDGEGIGDPRPEDMLDNTQCLPCGYIGQHELPRLLSDEDNQVSEVCREIQVHTKGDAKVLVRFVWGVERDGGSVQEAELMLELHLEHFSLILHVGGEATEGVSVKDASDSTFLGVQG